MEARCIDELLDKLPGPVTSPDRLRILRGVEVLEAIGSPEARRALEALARAPSNAYLADDAKAALERLAKRPSEKP